MELTKQLRSARQQKREERRKRGRGNSGLVFFLFFYHLTHAFSLEDVQTEQEDDPSSKKTS